MVLDGLGSYLQYQYNIETISDFLKCIYESYLSFAFYSLGKEGVNSLIVGGRKNYLGLSFNDMSTI